MILWFLYIFGGMKLPSSEVVVRNIEMLMIESGLSKSELSKLSGVTHRMIQYILSRERKPSIDVTDSIAAVFGLTGWQLLIPNLKYEKTHAERLAHLIDCYNSASEDSKDLITKTAEIASKYQASA